VVSTSSETAVFMLHRLLDVPARSSGGAACTPPMFAMNSASDTLDGGYAVRRDGATHRAPFELLESGGDRATRRRIDRAQASERLGARRAAGTAAWKHPQRPASRFEVGGRSVAERLV
jgi:hypothetical protein